MFVRCHSACPVGIDAIRITVEASLSMGIGMYLVGLPDNAVRESQDRIRSAFENSGLRMPGKRLVVNLAPADIRKEGSAFDLPIAVSILAASGQINTEALDRYIIVGELSLDGSVKPVRGALPMAMLAATEGFDGIILPRSNAPQAAVVDGIKVIGVSNLRQTAGFLSGTEEIAPLHRPLCEYAQERDCFFDEDFSDVKGQQHVKRALEIAAAGGHNAIMIGSPGSGKTMLARRMPSIMPPMSADEILETTKIYSVAGKTGNADTLILRRPFRAPHHMASQVALTGGGSSPQPGEVSLAHNGILFLDELPEFGRSVLEVLRQPLEDRKILVSRSKYSIEYPSNFMLIASMNPCPCGYYNHPTRECLCSSGTVTKYMNRISGPLLDRIDLHIEVTPVEISQLSGDTAEESSAEIRKRVIAARDIQQTRFAHAAGIHTNSMMSSRMLREFCPLDSASASLLAKAIDRLGLSARAYDRILKVARTIADLAAEKNITSAHIAEAISYRSLDRESWGR